MPGQSVLTGGNAPLGLLENNSRTSGDIYLNYFYVFIDTFLKGPLAVNGIFGLTFELSFRNPVLFACRLCFIKTAHVH